MLVTEAPDTDLTRTAATTPAPRKPPATDFLSPPEKSARRHIGPGAEETRQMLDLLGHSSLDALIDDAIPPGIRLSRRLQLPAGRGEHEVLAAIKAIAAQNQVFRSYIGIGYYDCITPTLIQRNV